MDTPVYSTFCSAPNKSRGEADGSVHNSPWELPATPRGGCLPAFPAKSPLTPSSHRILLDELRGLRQQIEASHAHTQGVFRAELSAAREEILKSVLPPGIYRETSKEKIQVRSSKFDCIKEESRSPRVGNGMKLAYSSQDGCNSAFQSEVSHTLVANQGSRLLESTDKKGIISGNLSEYSGNAKSENRVTRTSDRMSSSQNGMQYRAVVSVLSASGLRDADKFLFTGSSDPYCVCGVLGKAASKFQTPVIDNNCNPVWNHEGEIMSFDPTDTLEFKVFDKDYVPWKGDDFLGETQVSMGAMLDQGGFCGSMTLTDKRLRNCGKLQIKIILPHLMEEEEDQHHVQLLLDQSRVRWPMITEASLKEAKKTITSKSVFAPEGVTLGSFEGDAPSKHGHAFRSQSCLRHLIAHPFSTGRMCWVMTGVVCIMYDFFMIPFVAAFDLKENSILDTIGVVVTSFWFLDMFFSFLTGYSEGGLIEMRPKKIAKNYIQSWFLIDFLLLSIDAIYYCILYLGSSKNESAGSSSFFRIIRSSRAIRNLRLMTLIRISRSTMLLSVLWSQVSKETVRLWMQIVGMLGVVMALNHIICCGWYALGSVEAKDDRWTENKQMLKYHVLWRYVASMQWSFAQFTPAPTDIHARNELERLYQVIVNIIGLLCFSSFVSSITGQFNALRRVNADRMTQAANLRRFFNERGVSLQLSKCISDYLRYASQGEKKARLKEKDVPAFAELPKSLLMQLHFEMYVPQITRHPFFDALSKVDEVSFQKFCTRGLTELQITAGTEVFAPGTEAKGMYFVSVGDLNYHHGKDIETLQDGSWIGEPSLWITSWLHVGRFVGTSYCELILISLDKFIAVVIGTENAGVWSRAVRCYAGRFVRECSASSTWNDMWCDVSVLAKVTMDTMQVVFPGYELRVTKSNRSGNPLALFRNAFSISNSANFQSH